MARTDISGEVNYHIGFDFPWKPREARGYRPDSLAMHRFAVVVLLLLGGCFLVPHKIEMQQGNYVDQKMIERLKPEMSRSQVRFILGTPLIADPFHPQRWDYVYLTGRAGDVRRERRITVVFEEDRLVRIEGDAVPSALSRAPTEAAKP
jgi:outer membrane protein assembly factor BamE